MIIFGKGTAHLITGESETAVCPSCESEGSLVFDVYSNHFYLYWIPMFPTRRIGRAECVECGAEFKKNRMPIDMLRAYKELSNSVKPPFWQYTGMAIIIGGMTLSGIYGLYSKGIKEDIIKNPQKGDVYYQRGESGRYNTMEVVSVSEDSTYVYHSGYTLNIGRKLRDTKLTYDDVDSNRVAYSREYLEDLYERRIIFKVERDSD
ncbi:MAG: hypothetical protein ACPGYY_04225 [Bacteroidia bacterium]